MWWWHNNGWGWLWMTLSMVAFWAIVAAVVVALVRAGAPRGASGNRAADADAILAERYARGEISDEEYRHRRRELHARLDR